MTAPSSGTFLDDLNPQQREAAAHVDGPMLILAGAGSGKTRVITHRIAHLVRVAGASPTSILAVTFTNKAAGEMRRRVEGLLGPTLAAQVWISTFHSAGVRILRRDGGRIGLPRNLVIYDDGDQLGLVRRILKQLAIDESVVSPRRVLSRIDHAKSMGQGPDDLEVPPFDLEARKVQQVYRRYEKELRASGAVDFGDLLTEPLRLLREAPDVLERYRRTLRYLMVDEFQDTSPVQYALLRLLAGDRGNLVVVGDDDQSIYRWRGADVRNILTFERDYPDAKVVRLERNYRSTQVVLDAAYAVISRSPKRKEKRLWTERKGGEPVAVYQTNDEQDEARLVASLARSLSETIPPAEIAVFYRVNAQSRALEDALRAERVPYHIVRGRSFYDRAEIKDLVSYLRLAVNPDSDADFLRVVNTPRRGIGGTTIGRLQDAASEAGTSLFARLASGEAVPGIAKATLHKLDAFAGLLRRLHAAAEADHPPQEIVEAALVESGYVASLEADGSDEALERLENLEEMVSAATQRADEGKSLVDFLDEMALTGDADDEGEEPERISLMTLHAAKGLEFDAVILTGLEEKTFPHARAWREQGLVIDEEEMAEERRLCYVGFTRARKRLVLTFARSRWLLGQRQVRGPSRFLLDLPPELVQGAAVAPPPPPPTARRRFWEEDGLEAEPELGDEDGIVVDYSFDQRAPAASDVVGRRVRHRTFGVGRIRAVEGHGPDARLLVDFESVGTKKIVARYLEMI